MKSPIFSRITIKFRKRSILKRKVSRISWRLSPSAITLLLFLVRTERKKTSKLPALTKSRSWKLPSTMDCRSRKGPNPQWASRSRAGEWSSIRSNTPSPSKAKPKGWESSSGTKKPQKSASISREQIPSWRTSSRANKKRPSSIRSAKTYPGVDLEPWSSRERSWQKIFLRSGPKTMNRRIIDSTLIKRPSLDSWMNWSTEFLFWASQPSRINCKTTWNLPFRVSGAQESKSGWSLGIKWKLPSALAGLAIFRKVLSPTLKLNRPLLLICGKKTGKKSRLIWIRF